MIPRSTSEYYTRPDVAHVPVEDLPPNEVCLAWVAARRSRLIFAFAEILSSV